MANENNFRHMKKIVLFISLFTMVFCSCQKEEVDEIFDQTPEERVSEQLNAVQADLKSNEMGWLSTYTFSEGTEELVLVIKFIDDSRAEISAPELGMKQESSYTLRYTQQVDLIFDTYSFLAWLVDLGYKADFRWELDKQDDGQYFFKSRAASNEGESELIMAKATPEKLQFALRIQALKAKMKPNTDISYFRALELATGERFDYSFVNNKVVFEHIVNEEIVRFESEITLNDNGFVLTTPFVVDGKSISEFEYDEATGNFTIINADGVVGGINFSNSPVILPFGISEFGTSVADLLFIPSLNLKHCSSKFSELYNSVDADLKSKGFALTRFYLTPNDAMWLQINGKYQKIGYNSVVENGKVTFKITGSSISDENLFNALMPLLQLVFAPNGQYFIYEGKFENYSNKAYSFVSEDYPNMKLYMIDVS